MSTPSCIRLAIEACRPYRVWTKTTIPRTQLTSSQTSFSRPRVLTLTRSYSSTTRTHSAGGKQVASSIGGAPPIRSPVTTPRPSASRDQVQEQSTGAAVSSETSKADRFSRPPRNVAAAYLTPLRRRAEYGVPSCDLQLRSYTVRNVEFMADFAMRAAYYLHLPASGPIPLPKIIERWTMPRSNFVHKKSQENFERVTLRRMIQIQDGHPETVQVWLAFLRKHAFYGVGMKANVWQHEELGKYLPNCLRCLPSANENIHRGWKEHGQGIRRSRERTRRQIGYVRVESECQVYEICDRNAAEARQETDRRAHVGCKRSIKD